MKQGIFSQYDSQDLNRLAAKGILEKLRNIRQRINVEFIARRLLWELIQNAKDNSATCKVNGDPNVSIEIELNSKELRFSHNNGYFSNENIRGLIRRYSSSDKDRELDLTTSPPATTGRFGTGFMTTHLLSEKVEVTGSYQEDDAKFRKFSLPLDRTGTTDKEIIQSIENSFVSAEQSMINSEPFDFSSPQNFYTQFIYALNEDGNKLANIAIAEFEECIGYTMINIPNIERIVVNKNGNSFTYQINQISKIKINDRSISVFEIISNNSEILQKYFATIFEGISRIIIPVQIYNGIIEIRIPGKNVPRLFLDFPLIGTEELNIPFVINSPLFEPTETRDGVSLTGGDDKDTQTNSNILIHAFELFTEFIDYTSSQYSWINVYNLARIKKPKEKDWINQDWFNDNIIHPIRIKLLTSPLVDTDTGQRKTIKDERGQNVILFPSAAKPEVRENIWNLSNELIPDKLPGKSTIHEWYDIIWGECFELTLEELTIAIQRRENINLLSKNLNKSELETIKWLNNYYDLLNLEGKFIDEIVLDKFKVIPNQNLSFTEKSKLNRDVLIDEELKNVLKILNFDLRDILVDNRIITKNTINPDDSKIKYNSRDQESVIDQINKLLKENHERSSEAISYLISLFSSDDNFPKCRSLLYDFAKDLLGNEIPEKKEIKIWKDSIWEYADKARIWKLIKIISDCHSLSQLSNLLHNNNDQETIDWVQSFINFLIDGNFSERLNNKETPILPNQNGQFKIKDDLFLDNGEIDDDLKNIAKDLGYDIRAELLLKEIFLELPVSRIRTQEQVAKEISKLIRPILRDSDARENNKVVIRNLYLWMNKNRSIAELIFGEIYEKRFLLISDDEIAANIEKAEIIDEIIGETGLKPNEIKAKLIAMLKNPTMFEALLKYGSIKNIDGALYPEGCEEDIMISSDLLDFSSEKSRISVSEEAKEKVFETLRASGFVVPENISIKYTIVTGISKPDGTPIKIVVKSGKAGKIYFNPTEWLALTEKESQLFVITRGNIVRNVTLSDLEAINDSFHMRFNTKSFAINANLKVFASFFHYLPYTHFIFDTPEFATDYLQDFGLNQRNPSAGTLSADDKDLLH
jgi:hypothetical protein